MGLLLINGLHKLPYYQRDTLYPLDLLLCPHQLPLQTPILSISFIHNVHVLETAVPLLIFDILLLQAYISIHSSSLAIIRVRLMWGLLTLGGPEAVSVSHSRYLTPTLPEPREQMYMLGPRRYYWPLVVVELRYLPCCVLVFSQLCGYISRLKCIVLVCHSSLVEL